MTTLDWTRKLALAFAAAVLAACASIEPLDRAPAAPATEPWPHGAMVTAANPYAVDAAIEVLAAGGSAFDAAIAAHLVLGLVEPQSSGIGGGAFLLAFDRDAGSLEVFDGRETAPAGATADMFVHDGEVLNFLKAWQSTARHTTPTARWPGPTCSRRRSDWPPTASSSRRGSTTC